MSDARKKRQLVAPILQVGFDMNTYSRKLGKIYLIQQFSDSWYAEFW